MSEKIIESLEIVISEKCQNACKYCYRVKKHNLSNILFVDANILLDNLNFCIDFNKIKNVEFFGGDALIFPHVFKEYVKKLNENFKNLKYILIPTNSRTILEIPEKELEFFIENKCLFSCSVDSPFGDHLRPLSKFGQMLSFEEKINYEKLFKLARKYNFGFHPMLSFKNIANWFNITKFFIDNGFEPYLLEVRHPLSIEEAIKAVIELGKIKYHYKEKALNTTNLSLVPRGTSCSAQTCLTVMPNGDIPFCHRLIDPPWIIGNIYKKTFDIGKYIHFKIVFNFRNTPVCVSCPIRHVCSGQCMGACYEYWGDPWTPIPSICRYLRLKTLVFYNIFDDWKEIETYVDINHLYEAVKMDFEKETILEDIINEIRPE